MEFNQIEKSSAETCTPEPTVALSGIFGGGDWGVGLRKLSRENPVQSAPIHQKNPIHCFINYKCIPLTGNKPAKSEGQRDKNMNYLHRTYGMREMKCCIYWK